MQITKQIRIDMANRQLTEPAYAVQGDSNTRIISAMLLENNIPWEVPTGVTAAVAFQKPDKTKGLYDHLPDGSPAISISGNVVKAILAPQVLSCSGEVRASIVFHDSDLTQLATFPFYIDVAENPASGQSVSNDYYRYSTLEEVNEAVKAAIASLEKAKEDFMAETGKAQADFLEKAEEALSVVHGAATEDAPAIVCEATGQTVQVADASNRVLHGLTLYGKTTQNGTPTPESPVPLESVGDGGSVAVTVAGKNLLPFPYKLGGAGTVIESNGGKIMCLADGGLSISGTPTAHIGYRLYAGELIFKGKQTFRLHGSFDNYNATVFLYEDANASTELARITVNNSKQFDTNDYPTATYMIIESARVNNNVAMSGTIYPMLVTGDVAPAEYEPYRPVQTLTAQTPNGLPGIDVTDNPSLWQYANITDSEGKKWVCDYIDFARGVYVQKCPIAIMTSDRRFEGVTKLGENCRIEVYFEANEKTNGLTHGLFSHGSYMNEYTLDTTHAYAGTNKAFLYLPLQDGTIDAAKAYFDAEYQKGTPVTLGYVTRYERETPLSAEELAQYAALHSNKPNTTVFNDSGAEMKLSYVADTKLYIDSKFAAISAAILNA